MARTGASKANALTLREISDLIAVSVKKQGKTVTAETAKLCYLALIEIIADELKRNGKFVITNIGSLETYMFGGFMRNSYNVQTKEHKLEKVPETVVVKFNPSDYIKAYLNNREIPLGMRRRSKEVEKKARVSKTKKELLKKEMAVKKKKKYEKNVQPIEIDVEEED